MQRTLESLLLELFGPAASDDSATLEEAPLAPPSAKKTRMMDGGLLFFSRRLSPSPPDAEAVLEQHGIGGFE